MGLDVYIFKRIEDYPPEYWVWKSKKEKCLDGLKDFIGFDEDNDCHSDYRELYYKLEAYFDYQSPYDTEPLYHGNISHNFNKIAKEAGIYHELWRPDEMSPAITTAGELIKPLTEGLNRIKKNKEYYKKFVKNNNGYNELYDIVLYGRFVIFLEKYLDACIKYPNNPIEVDR